MLLGRKSPFSHLIFGLDSHDPLEGLLFMLLMSLPREGFL
jgi:hypothetical protein